MRSTPDIVSSSGGDLFVRGGTVVPMDGTGEVYTSTDVLVRGGRIAALGEGLSPGPGVPSLDARGDLVLPGLVQGHVHFGQTLFRGLAEGRRLLSWLRERIWPLEAAHDDESAYWSGMLGAAECLLTGTTTVQDMGLGPGIHGLFEALEDSGLRAWAGLCLMDEGEGLPPGLRQDPHKALAQCEVLASRYESPRVRYLLNPRFVLSCSDELWQGVAELARLRSWPVHTHALEQEEETVLVRRTRAGRDEIEYFDDLGILETDLRLAHGVWLTEDHLERLARVQVSVIHCPSANLKLGSGIADLSALAGAGIPTGLGSDGPPCSNDLDGWKEIRLAALLQKLRNGPERMSGHEALEMGTRGGAKAIGLHRELGSLEVGKAADLVVVDGTRPELWGADGVDLHDLLVFGGSRAHVKHVTIGGKIMVEHGRLLHLDLQEIRHRASRAARHLLQRAQI